MSVIEFPKIKATTTADVDETEIDILVEEFVDDLDDVLDLEEIMSCAANDDSIFGDDDEYLDISFTAFQEALDALDCNDYEWYQDLYSRSPDDSEY